MTTLPDLDESGVYTFESAGTLPTVQYVVQEEPNADIDESLPPRSEVLECVVTSKELASGSNLDGRIARIAREIEELRQASEDSRLDDLSQQLAKFRQSRVVHKYQTQPYIEKSLDIPSNSKDFSGLEERIAALEKKIGSSSTPVTLLPALQQMRAHIALISQAPENIEQTAEALRGVCQQLRDAPVKDKVSAVYERLETLGPVLDQLPQISARLQTLQALHTEQAVIQGFLKDAEQTLRQMHTDIGRWNDRLDTVERELTQTRN